MKPDPVRHRCRSPWAVQTGPFSHTHLPWPQISLVRVITSQQEQTLLVQVTILGPDPVNFSVTLTPVVKQRAALISKTSKTSSVANQSLSDRERENKDAGSKSIRVLLTRDLPQTRDGTEPHHCTGGANRQSSCKSNHPNVSYGLAKSDGGVDAPENQILSLGKKDICFQKKIKTSQWQLIRDRGEKLWFGETHGEKQPTNQQTQQTCKGEIMENHRIAQLERTSKYHLVQPLVGKGA